MTTPKKPQDHQPKADADDPTTYTYATNGGGKVVVPLMSHLKFGVARKMRNLGESEQVFALVEAVCDEATLALVDDMDPAEVAQFMEGWGEASGIDVGESSASSDS